MKLSVPVYKLKRHAKRMARERGAPLHSTLDEVAREEGYRGWSHLASALAKDRPAQRILLALDPGDLVLLAARPGHGKTLLSLEMAVEAGKAGWASHFFTLDFTEADVRDHARDIGRTPDEVKAALRLDTSDAICADYMIQRLDQAGGKGFAVVDYLQLLDQRRSNAPLQTQISELRGYAQQTGAIIVAISQVDRLFDASQREMPTLDDVRLPNPLDLSLFSKTCFLHAGDVQMSAAA